MTKELLRELQPISQSFYEWLSQATIDNWREPVESPVDGFISYGGKDGADLARLYGDYENDPAATQEIDNYLRQVITAVNNGTVVEHRGGARENSGRKRKTVGEKSVTVSFCCSPEQKAALQEAARTSGMKQGEYILSELFKS